MAIYTIYVKDVQFSVTYDGDRTGNKPFVLTTPWHSLNFRTQSAALDCLVAVVNLYRHGEK